MALAKPARLVFHAPIESSGGIVRSLRAPGAVVLAFALLVPTGPPAGATNPRQRAGPSVFGPRNRNVSRLTSNQAETSVAINPTDPANIVVTSNLATFRGLLEAYSSDGGATWKTQIIANGDDLGLACASALQLELEVRLERAVHRTGPPGAQRAAVAGDLEHQGMLEAAEALGKHRIGAVAATTRLPESSRMAASATLRR